MSGRAHDGSVLVIVLLVSLTIWLLLASVLLITRLQFEVAVATRDHAVAWTFAEQLIEERRADPSLLSEPATTDEVGETGHCTWRVTLLDRSDTATWYEAQVAYGRAQVTFDATIHRPLALSPPEPVEP